MADRPSIKKPRKKAAKKSGPNSGKKPPMAIQPHGGALRVGSLPGNTPGTGRPPDQIRAAMRDLGATKGLPFLSKLMEGEVELLFVGKCPNCGEESEPNVMIVKALQDTVRATVEHRLKALEQAWKYGLGTKDETKVSADESLAALIANTPRKP